jgi:hypothetical protein
MPLELGTAFRPRPTVDVQPSEPAPPSAEDLRTEQVLAALGELRVALSSMPAPVVQVAEPDLSAIVTAVTNLKGSGSPDEIAEAVVQQIGGDTRQPLEPILERLAEALTTLDFRLKGLGTGGGGPSGLLDLKDRPERVLGKIAVSDPLPAGSNNLGYVSTGLTQKISEGKFRFSGGDVTTDLTETDAFFILANPAASTTNVNITQFKLFINDTAGARVRFLHEASTTVGTARETFNPNHYFEAAPTNGVLRVGKGTAGAGGGTELLQGRVVRDAPYQFEGLVVLPPGHSFGVRITGAATGSVIVASVGWFEE